MMDLAFATAFRTHFAQTVAALRRFGLPDLAEDIAQAAWAKAWACRDDLRDENRQYSWVATIARNLANDELRRRRSVRAHSMGWSFAADVPPNLAALEVERILCRCTERQRGLLQTVYLQERSLAEIALEYGISRNALVARIARALKAARQQLNVAPADTGRLFARKESKGLAHHDSERPV